MSEPIHDGDGREDSVTLPYDRRRASPAARTWSSRASSSCRGAPASRWTVSRSLAPRPSNQLRAVGWGTWSAPGQIGHRWTRIGRIWHSLGACGGVFQERVRRSQKAAGSVAGVEQPSTWRWASRGGPGYGGASITRRCRVCSHSIRRGRPPPGVAALETANGRTLPAVQCGRGRPGCGRRSAASRPTRC
jgi:hypothetical protein